MQPDKAVNNEKQVPCRVGKYSAKVFFFGWVSRLSWQKVDIESKKVDIESVFSEKGKNFLFVRELSTFLW